MSRCEVNYFPEHIVGGGVLMLKTWFVALRPWSFTASLIPVSLGAILAWNEGYFHPLLFVLSLIGGVAMHAGTNLINTYGDYLSGVDTEESAPTCPQLVRNILKPEDMRLVGIGFFIFTIAIGLYLTKVRGMLLLIIGVLGIIGGYGYTLGIAYKYKGLGVFLVFILMGPMMVWGAYFVQTGVSSWLPVWASLPIGFLVSAIMHGNDFRDIDYDRQAGIKTLAIFLGKENSVKFYCFLNLAPVVSIVVLVGLRVLPFIALLPLLLLPQIRQIIMDIKAAGQGDRKKLGALEQASAQLHFTFGSLFVVAMLINLAL
jgi:1,4-dihydroxy-2-naphthoate octaprenyltransferase